MRQFERDFPATSCRDLDKPMVLSLIKDLPDTVSGGSRSSTNLHPLSPVNVAALTYQLRS